MKGRHAASGWSPFWRDILVRVFLVLLLVAMAVFIWWLFSEDDLFTENLTPTTEQAPVTSTLAPSTTSEPAAPTSTVTTAAGAAPETTVAEPVTTTVPPSTSTTTTVPPPLAPDELVVRVLNANGVSGVAGRTSGLIEDAGYGTARAGNHALRVDRSEVLYREGLEREAEQLRVALVPDAVLSPMTAAHEENPHAEGVDLLVVLGRSFEE